MTILFLISCSVLLTYILGMLISSGSGLPEGYEDDRGFHFGSDRRAK